MIHEAPDSLADPIARSADALNAFFAARASAAEPVEERSTDGASATAPTHARSSLGQFTSEEQIRARIDDVRAEIVKLPEGAHAREQLERERIALYRLISGADHPIGQTKFQDQAGEMHDRPPVPALTADSLTRPDGASFDPAMVPSINVALGQAAQRGAHVEAERVTSAYWEAIQDAERGLFYDEATSAATLTAMYGPEQAATVRRDASAVLARLPAELRQRIEDDDYPQYHPRVRLALARAAEKFAR